MFDYSKVKDTIVQQTEDFVKTAESTIDTVVDQMEETTKTVNGYITDKKAKTFVDALAEAQYSTVRNAISNYRLALKSISI